MTTQESSGRNLTHSILPWAVAGVALVIYLVTLNHWVSLASLPVVTRITGWDWRPLSTAPVYVILAYPARWLPVSLQFIALNAMSALFAALTLALLVRSVRLLPQDRTRDQRLREPGEHWLLSGPYNWVPPIVAAIICGLQLTFWEHATVATGEMLDLLLFAYVVRCLLEYRVSTNERWLSKLALIYGLAITNNWAMIGFFPLFLIALIWIKRMSFFDLGFLTRMVAFGCAGLLFYFVLPMREALSAHPGATFFETLKENLRLQKGLTINNPFFRSASLRWDLFTLSLTSIMPVFLMGIRWPSFHGDASAAGGAMAAFMFRVLHITVLGFSLWLFLDPKFSGRVLGHGWLSFLSFYYLAALSVGYLVAYVIVVFGREAERNHRRDNRSMRPLNRAFVVVVCVAAFAVPTGLIWRNLPVVRATNGPELRRMATEMARELPQKGAMIMSDDFYRLFLVDVVWRQSGTPHHDLLVETRSLPYPHYHRKMHERYPEFQDVLPKLETLPEFVHDAFLIQMVDKISEKLDIYYLHSSFGYYFERFYAEPHGLVYKLHRYQKDDIKAPALSAEVVSENQKFWGEFLPRIETAIPTAMAKSVDMTWVGACYSQALNCWGVELQRLNRLNDASTFFATALKLNPDNIVALINHRFNVELAKGGRVQGLGPDPEIDKKVAQYRSWDVAMAMNGPFDELDTCLNVGQVFSAGGNLRQGVVNFLRVLDFAPDNLQAYAGLINNYINMGHPEKALGAVAEARKHITSTSSEIDDLQLTWLEARAYVAQKKYSLAEELLLVLQGKRADDPRMIDILVQFYTLAERYKDGLNLVEKQLKATPDDSSALLNAAALTMHLKDYTKSIEFLDRLLKNDPQQPHALLDRALVYLSLKKYAEAKRDYLAAEKVSTDHLFAIYYGLQEVAFQTGQKEDAIKYAKLYLQHAPPMTKEYEGVAARLQELHSTKKP